MHGAPLRQRVPARLASRAPGASATAVDAAVGVDPVPVPTDPDAVEAAQPVHAIDNTAAASNARAVGRVNAVSDMRRGAAAVDADATLTYHRFFMSRPFPRALAPSFPPTVVRLLTLLALSGTALFAVASGCASVDDEGKPVTYSLTAKQNYEKGLAELKDENYPEAQKYFQFVKSKYPFSKYAVLAELGIADTQFARGNYTEAIDSYKSFTRLHPTHEKVEDGYVAFRICESYYKDMPEDVWLLPPAYEKDQSAIVDAQREIDDFRKKFPTSPYMKQAEEIRREVLKRLVDHEVYVARFYLKSDHPKAAAGRLEGAIKRYPGSGREPELLFSLGETYLHMCEPQRAKETFARVVAEYGTAPQARRSELYLEHITQRYGPQPVCKAPPTAVPAPPPPPPEPGPRG
jgi:outer membrane protein assembly factor BamD